MPPIRTVAVAPSSRAGGRKTPSPTLGVLDPVPQSLIKARQAELRQGNHRYRVGERLRMSHGGNTVARAASYCKVLTLMPHEGHGELLYRVRSETEQFERIVTEADLSRQ